MTLPLTESKVPSTVPLISRPTLAAMSSSVCVRWFQEYMPRNSTRRPPAMRRKRRNVTVAPVRAAGKKRTAVPEKGDGPSCTCKD